jgi:hypothetical protein
MADNFSHEYQLENPIIDDRQEITRETWILLTGSEHIYSQ